MANLSVDNGVLQYKETSYQISQMTSVKPVTVKRERKINYVSLKPILPLLKSTNGSKFTSSPECFFKALPVSYTATAILIQSYLGKLCKIIMYQGFCDVTRDEGILLHTRGAFRNALQIFAF